MSEHLVIVGGGQAAVQAAQSARQSGFTGALTLVGDESRPPYQRPPLSKKYLAGELDADRLLIRPQQFYRDRQVILKLGVHAEEIEPSARRVRLDDDSTLDYDYLLLATGSRVRRLQVPGSELEGVYYLRTIADGDAIRRHLSTAERIVVVGGGYIGLEVAAVCRRLGLDVTILEATDRILGRVVAADTARFFARLHADAGVAIHCNAVVTEIKGGRQVSAVVCADGRTFDCDAVIIGIGILPNDSLASTAGLPCENGILVDVLARTADPRIAAAGDCTNQPHPWVGTRIRLESVHNAIEQAKAATKSLFEAPTEFSDVPWFWSDQYDVKLQIAGISSPHDEVIIRGEPRAGSFAVYYLADGLPVAVDAINSPKDFLFAKKILRKRIPIPAEIIRDATRDLSEFAEP
jgi:3-phenylpropionate/trans-cinnamate dioxygenase ferredoxin reductase subunit